jgi:hypothetical protein
MSGRRLLLYAGLAILLGVAACVSSLQLVRMQSDLGPRTQRIYIRFVPGISIEARERIERDAGLYAREEREPRTWSYLLSNHTPQNIRALLSNPAVEDTAHVDRARFRVEIDRPDLPGWLRELLQEESLPQISRWLTAIALASFACATVFLWRARHQIQAALTRATKALVSTAVRTWPVIERQALRIASFFDQPAEPIARGEIVAGLLLGLVFLAPLLMSGPGDDEELGLGVFSSQIYYRELLHGRWLYWLNDLAFGMPLPLGQRFDFHPLFAIGSLFSLRAAVSAVWLAHVAVMVVYFIRLAALAGAGRRLRLTLLAFYVFSVPSVVLFYWTDWLSCIIPWTWYPVVLYYLHDALTGGAERRFWPTAIRLGLILGVWIINSHAGYLVPLVICLAAYVLTAAPRTRSTYGALLMSAVFALLISAERIYFLLHERSFFPPDLAKATQGGFSIWRYLTTAAAPLLGRNERDLPFIGGTMLVAALASVFIVRRVHNRHVRGCVVAFVVALAMGLMPIDYLRPTGLSGVWVFRDPMVFFGLLAAILTITSVLQRRSHAMRVAIGLLVVVQIAQQSAIIGRDIRPYLDGRRVLRFYRDQGTPTGFGAIVVRLAAEHGTRIYLSNNAHQLSRGFLTPSGIYVPTDYALLGLNPVNGWFKNISMDRFYPSPMLMHGAIGGQQEVIDNPTLLDVLGIDLVITAAGDPPPRALSLLERPHVGTRGGGVADLEILSNADAWPDAVMLRPDALAVQLPVVPGCGHTGVMCRQFEPLAATRLPDQAVVTEENGDYQVTVSPSASERVLFVSALYRPEWVATSSSAPLEVEPIAGAFVGVRVPPGARDVHLVFTPTTRVALTKISATSLVILILAAAWTLWPQRQGGYGGLGRRRSTRSHGGHGDARRIAVGVIQRLK